MRRIGGTTGRPGRRAVVIDNYDSFTYNLVQYLDLAGARTVVKRNTASLAELRRAAPDLLVLSPGPGTVEDPAAYGITMDALDHFVGKVPVLGVCLGHQAVGAYFGGKVRLAEVRHGHLSQVQVDRPDALFAGVPARFPAMRYHSQVLDRPSLPRSLLVTAVATDDAAVMAVAHRDLPVYGVQFHPESLGTPAGPRIVSNFVSLGQ